MATFKQGKNMTNENIDYSFVNSVLTIKASEVSVSGVSEDLNIPDGKSISELLNEKENNQEES